MSTINGLTVTRNKIFLTTANPFEQKFGYHRAVKRGPFIAVSGTTALKLREPSSLSSSTGVSTSEAVIKSESNVHCPGEAYGQTMHVLETCLAAVIRLGGKKEDVIRVRMFVATSSDCGIVGEAFKEVFGSQGGQVSDTSGHDEDVIGVAATMVVVPGGFVDDDILVEIEMDAFVV